MAVEHTVRILDDPTTLDAASWNALLACQAAPTPFMRHEYLSALHRSRSAVPASGWMPQWIVVEHGGALQAACAAYLKSHSYGEYVFDWAWADAYRRHGLDYYPKLLCAVPFTPVPGSRLLARDGAGRDLLLASMRALAQSAGLSSVHVLFFDDDERAACERAGWMLRDGVQFHWTNRAPLPYADFGEFLAGLQREKRKKIAQERRRVAQAGVVLRAVEGAAIDNTLWEFFYRCYTQTYRAHHSTPYLTRAFFAEIARSMPEHWLMFVAERGDERIAASLIALDPARRAAYGRYWGATHPVPCLHFDAPLAWCIEHEYHRFEGGAQGEHKMARGLLPVRTGSAHWLADARFASAVDDFLAREGAGVQAYLDELNERNPFKDA
jgi:predicted N-acyltransferase